MSISIWAIISQTEMPRADGKGTFMVDDTNQMLFGYGWNAESAMAEAKRQYPDALGFKMEGADGSYIPGNGCTCGAEADAMPGW